MTSVTISLDACPNQTVSVVINEIRWTIILNTRLGQLFATVENDAVGIIVSNRICLNKVPITENLVFIDSGGDKSPTYDGLNGRFFLVFTDES